MVHNGEVSQNGICVPAVTANGVTLDSVLVQSNAGYGVVLDGVSDDNSTVNPVFRAYYTGFFGASYTQGMKLACLNGDGIGPTGYTNSLDNPIPSDTGWFQRTSSAVDMGQVMNSCPLTLWPMEPLPSHSNVPNWKW